jgi:hypothetical protein
MMEALPANRTGQPGADEPSARNAITTLAVIPVVSSSPSQRTYTTLPETFRSQKGSRARLTGNPGTSVPVGLSR